MLHESFRHLESNTNWWGYSLEIAIQDTETNVNEKVESIESSEKTNLPVIVEERLHFCYFCIKTSHIKMSPQYVRENTTPEIKIQDHEAIVTEQTDHDISQESDQDFT